MILVPITFITVLLCLEMASNKLSNRILIPKRGEPVVTFLFLAFLAISNGPKSAHADLVYTQRFKEAVIPESRKVVAQTMECVREILDNKHEDGVTFSAGIMQGLIDNYRSKNLVGMKTAQDSCFKTRDSMFDLFRGIYSKSGVSDSTMPKSSRVQFSEIQGLNVENSVKSLLGSFVKPTVTCLKFSDSFMGGYLFAIDVGLKIGMCSGNNGKYWAILGGEFGMGYAYAAIVDGDLDSFQTMLYSDEINDLNGSLFNKAAGAYWVGLSAAKSLGRRPILLHKLYKKMDSLDKLLQQAKSNEDRTLPAMYKYELEAVKMRIQEVEQDSAMEYNPAFGIGAAILWGIDGERKFQFLTGDSFLLLSEFDKALSRSKGGSQISAGNSQKIN